MTTQQNNPPKNLNGDATINLSCVASKKGVTIKVLILKNSNYVIISIKPPIRLNR